MKVFIFLILLFLSVWGNEFEEIKQQYFKSYDYEQMQKYDEAIKVLIPLYKKYPNGYTLNLRIGWLSYVSKKYKDAQSYYEKASLASPYALDPKLGLIRIFLDTQSYQKAEISASELLKIDYYNYYANLYIIKALNAQKKYEEALGVVQKMLSLYPTNISYLEQLAVVYKQMQSPYLQQVYEDILVLDPNNVFVRSKEK